MRNNWPTNIIYLMILLPAKKKKEIIDVGKKWQALGADFTVASNFTVAINDLVQFYIGLFFCENGRWYLPHRTKETTIYRVIKYTRVCLSLWDYINSLLMRPISPISIFLYVLIESKWPLWFHYFVSAALNIQSFLFSRRSKLTFFCSPHKTCTQVNWSVSSSCRICVRPHVIFGFSLLFWMTIALGSQIKLSVANSS